MKTERAKDDKVQAVEPGNHKVVCFVCKKTVNQDETRELPFKNGTKVDVCAVHIKYAV